MKNYLAILLFTLLNVGGGWLLPPTHGLSGFLIGIGTGLAFVYGKYRREN